MKCPPHIIILKCPNVVQSGRLLRLALWTSMSVPYGRQPHPWGSASPQTFTKPPVTPTHALCHIVYFIYTRCLLTCENLCMNSIRIIFSGQQRPEWSVFMWEDPQMKRSTGADWYHIWTRIDSRWKDSSSDVTGPGWQRCRQRGIRWKLKWYWGCQMWSRQCTRPWITWC